MKNTLLFLFVLLAGYAQGQVVATGSPAMTYVSKGSGDMFQSNLYSADRIMDMRDKLNLTDAQATKIKKIHAENAGQFSTLKWDLEEENAKLKKMLEPNKIDQVAVNKQMDKILDLENQLKKKQLNNLVAIKNELTEEQLITLAQNQVYVVRADGVKGPVKIVDGVAISSSVSGYTTAYDSPKVALSIAGTPSGAQPVFYIETKSGLKKVPTLEGVNPKDIEAINVLKGDEATKLYGKDGENGVIVIKLKNKPE
ncbi:periplasmic heavy metal sensor [Algoriphagus aestuariicola]|uniref:Periplasmic heavy metal sensor n=1 Tax=Algoriphagus aestuariicola TaxID=1852016 RepID=A0ABS3BRN0_9BACT|nr:Spy/CpxP family protein refolding chaperone [Algoriphagus aestuariicola]MBN7801932.1 periplasmic heavy metal sensor [Algoriphagus aestuariicola]